MSESTRAPGIAIGSAAPATTFVDAEGTRRSVGDLLDRAAGLPVLLAFFKTGCPTCQLLWPYLQKLHTLLGGAAVHLAGVCQNRAAEGAAHYADYGQATFDLLVDPEPRFAASNAFGVEAVPHLVLVSPDGVVAKVVTGWSRREMDAMAGELALARRLAPGPLVDRADPVREWQAG
jgi:peroxiredoxin